MEAQMNDPHTSIIADDLDQLQQIAELRQQLAASRAEVERLRIGLQDCIGCFDAAMVEGLLEVLAESDDERLCDLVNRRLMFVCDYAQAALSAQVAKV
jgi:hypothetical protein